LLESLAAVAAGLGTSEGPPEREPPAREALASWGLLDGIHPAGPESAVELRGAEAAERAAAAGRELCPEPGTALCLRRSFLESFSATGGEEATSVAASVAVAVGDAKGRERARNRGVGGCSWHGAAGAGPEGGDAISSSGGAPEATGLVEVSRSPVPERGGGGVACFGQPMGRASAWEACRLHWGRARGEAGGGRPSDALCLDVDEAGVPLDLVWCLSVRQGARAGSSLGINSSAAAPRGPSAEAPCATGESGRPPWPAARGLPWVARPGVPLDCRSRPVLWVLEEPWRDGGEWLMPPWRSGPGAWAWRAEANDCAGEWLDGRREGCGDPRLMEAWRLDACPGAGRLSLRGRERAWQGVDTAVSGCGGLPTLGPHPACELAGELER
jgi:hypothetical protein